MPTKTSSSRTPFPEGLAQPALRALANAGCDHLEQLVSVSEEDVRSWHGIGPTALTKLQAALTLLGLSFAAEQATDDRIDSYISQFPADVQAVLRKVRETIRKAAPQAEEVISYKMPAFRQHGILVYFAAWKTHIGLYPPISGDLALEKTVAPYAGPKGNLQFPLDKSIPFKLIERIVKLRVKQDTETKGSVRTQAEGIKMNIEIIEQPIRFQLHGISGVVKNERYGEVGLRLMNEMWQVVKGNGISTTGINHWVYLPAGRMFVGVLLRNPYQAPLPDQLEPLEFALQRYLKHLHVGPYQALPQKWKDLQAELVTRGEAIGSPSLEVYGHHCEEPSELETTILMGLKPKPA